jgi:glycosyltransferase involved in cell wall biosynthesis
MRRLVLITQVVDAEDPVLGATVAKIRALAAHVDDVVVLSLKEPRGEIPPRCRVHSFGAPTRPECVVLFESQLARALSPRPVAVLAHMAPMFALLAAPLCRGRGVPLLLWFAHWRASRLLRLAEWVSNAVVTVDRRSFPLPSRKVSAIGHGIDLNAFPPVPPHQNGDLRVLSLGRYSPAKGLDTVVRAVAMTNDATLVHHGPCTTDEERHTKQALERLVAELRADDRVALHGPVPRHEVPHLFFGADVLVNNMRGGAADKVVYEAAAAQLPVLASSSTFDGLLPVALRFPRDDPEVLADRLRGLVTLDRGEIGRRLHESVAAEHSVDQWAVRVLAVAGAA